MSEAQQLATPAEQMRERPRIGSQGQKSLAPDMTQCEHKGTDNNQTSHLMQHLYGAGVIALVLAAVEKGTSDE